MNREIKFRAYCQVCQEMVWVCDGFFQFKDGLQYQCPNHNVQTFTQLMQYTGLKDKNGKEIYEGDIVSNPDYLEAQLIKFEFGAFYATSPTIAGDILAFRHNKIEVIGNIYETPELLKGGE